MNLNDRTLDEMTAENARLRAEAQGLRDDLQDAGKALVEARRGRDRARADLKLACAWLSDFDPDWSPTTLEAELRAWADGRSDRQRPSPARRLESRETLMAENRQLRVDFEEVREHRDRLRIEAWLDALEPIIRSEVSVEEDGGVVRRGFLFYEARDVVIDGQDVRLLAGLRLAEEEKGVESLDISKIVRVWKTPQAKAAASDDEPIPF